MRTTGLFMLAIAVLIAVFEGIRLATGAPTISQWVWDAESSSKLFQGGLTFGLGFLTCHLLLGKNGNG